MPLTVKHDMLRLQISVDNKVLMEVLNGAQDFSHIELHVILDLELVRAYATQKITSLDQVHLNVDAFCVLKRGVSLDNEAATIPGLAQVQDDFLFTHNVLSVLS